MDYESFLAAWLHALRESRLPTIGLLGDETLDTRTLAREYTVCVEPLGGQDAEPFNITATLSWRWDSMNTMRGTFRDEDVLSEMLGRDHSAELVTENPSVRVDIKLTASAPYDKPFPLPAQTRWAAWVHETLERLDRIEPLLPRETARENRMGMLEVLGWQEKPRATVVCTEDGDLRLESVEISAGQIIELPRLLDCPDEPDAGPEGQLGALFQRVRASLMAWMQAVDHLRPR